MNTSTSIGLVVLSTLAISASRVGAVNIETVPVGHPGNAGELTGIGAGGGGPDAIVGGVDYTYAIGKYEITTAQYTAFLNAVATEDAHGLYNTYMDPAIQTFGCGIVRSGSPGEYTYSVSVDRANRPVNYVSWADAARFANWMHNGQPVGEQNPSTTESGSYDLNGANTVEALQAVNRNQNATWVIPTEHEWYKAAYHKNDGATGNYYDYPTRSNTHPSNILADPDPGNNATYYDHRGYGNLGYTIGSPYYRTEVGAHENSFSPYGTFDQGGNAWEFNEAVIDTLFRGIRGGAAGYWDSYLHAADRDQFVRPVYEYDAIGFRLALVPEPATGLLIAVFVGLGPRRKALPSRRYAGL